MLAYLIAPCLGIACFNWSGTQQILLSDWSAGQSAGFQARGGRREWNRSVSEMCSGDFNASYVQCVNVGGWFSADTLHREHQYQRNRTLVGVQPSSQSVRRQDSSDLSQQTPHLLISESCLGWKNHWLESESSNVSWWLHWATAPTKMGLSWP